MRKRRLVYLVALGIVVGIVAGCGGGDEAEPAQTEAAATVAEETVAEETVAEETAAAETGAEAGTETTEEALDPAAVKEGFLAEDWSYPILVTDCDAPDTKPNGCYGTATPATYEAIPKSEITKQWNVCVSFPHLKDPYWVATNYGVVREAERDGAKMSLFEAGGYTNLPTQVSQLEDCVAAGAEAIVVGAISYDGLDAQINKYRDDGIVVVEGFNGINTPEVNGHALIDFYNSGKTAAEYLANLAEETGQELNVVLVPGPPGAGWSERTATGFKDGAEGTMVNVLDTKFADTGKDIQLGLVEDALQSYDDVDWIVGNAVAAEGAAIAVQEAGLADKTKILSTYVIPSNLDLVKSGGIACIVADQAVAQATMAFDLAIRALEGKPAVGDLTKVWASPVPNVVCGDGAGEGQNNLDELVVEAALAPDDFSPTFNVG